MLDVGKHMHLNQSLFQSIAYLLFSVSLSKMNGHERDRSGNYIISFCFIQNSKINSEPNYYYKLCSITFKLLKILLTNKNTNPFFNIVGKQLS